MRVCSQPRVLAVYSRPRFRLCVCVCLCLCVCVTQVNVVDFNVVGLSFVGGALTITASFAPASGQRVDIKFREATLVGFTHMHTHTHTETHRHMCMYVSGACMPIVDIKFREATLVRHQGRTHTHTVCSYCFYLGC